MFCNISMSCYWQQQKLQVPYIFYYQLQVLNWNRTGRWPAFQKGPLSFLARDQKQQQQEKQKRKTETNHQWWSIMSSWHSMFEVMGHGTYIVIGNLSILWRSFFNILTLKVLFHWWRGVMEVSPKSWLNDCSNSSGEEFWAEMFSQGGQVKVQLVCNLHWCQKTLCFWPSTLSLFSKNKTIEHFKKMMALKNVADHEKLFMEVVAHLRPHLVFFLSGQSKNSLHKVDWWKSSWLPN